ncbi:hypothetical protein [Agrobacterium tumefaciens]|uniref:hypothetical protein n=1 Tax=Agrobacterium tumefaciens TaxID=358 RepID=UPI00287E5FFA|nr:hypothetical protein [Agrobacterium tumefaciens]MDS7595418.1 hypothetical protein [Agrobacterium tumefaciens]
MIEVCGYVRYWRFVAVNAATVPRLVENYSRALSTESQQSLRAEVTFPTPPKNVAETQLLPQELWQNTYAFSDSKPRL